MPSAVPRPLGTSEPTALPAPQRPVRGRGPIALPVSEQDASVPMDRVPYFRADLARIGITAAAMFGLLVVGSFFIR